MKIKYMLLVGSGVSIALVFVFSLMVYVSFNKVAEENERELIAQEIHKTISELDMVMYEYLTHREERMLQQWDLTYAATAEIIEKLAEEEWGAIKSNYADLKSLFSKVTANYEKQGSGELEERLVAQILIKSQVIIFNSSAIAKEAYNNAIEAQVAANHSMMSAFIVLFVVLVGLSFHTARRITNPLNKLIRGTEIIGKGNLKHRVDIKTKNEIGGLAVAFNQMTENLKKVTASRDEFNKEIIEHKEAERHIRQQNEFLNSVLESLAHPFYVVDANNYTVKMANAAANRGELSEETTCYMLTHKRDKPCDGVDDPCPLKEIIKTKKSVVVEHIHYDKEGNPRNVEVHGHPIFDSSGNVCQMIEYSLDITDRKQAEKEILERETRYKTLVENLPQKIFLKDEKSGYISCNENYARDLKISPYEIAGRTDYDFYPDELAEKYRRDDKRIMEAGKVEDLEEKYIRDGQEEAWVHTVKTPVRDDQGNIIGILGIFWDITERKQAEKRVLDLAKFPSENPNPVLRISNDGVILFSNEASRPVLQTWGIQQGQHLPDNYFQRVEEVVSSGKACSFEFGCSDGRIFLMTLAPVEDADYVNAYALDITDRKQAEEEIKRSKEYAELILKVTPSATFAVDTNRCITNWNKRAEEITGYTSEEMLGKECAVFAEVPCKDKCGLYLGDVKKPIINRECTIRKKDGQMCIISKNADLLKDEKGNVIGGIESFEDITERKKAKEEKEQLQAQLRQTQKMEAIGTLAGGIAHDFNNILAALIGYTDLAKDDIPEGTVAHDNLEQSLLCCNRAKDLVQQILTFSRKTEGEKKTVQIAPIVKGALKMLRSSLPTTIDIQQNIEADSSFALADPTQIHQIVLNLCTNASYAMGEQGGVMEVNLIDIDFETDTKVNNQWFKRGSYVKLTVSDTGCGMDETTLERIFEPFYTTKEVGKSTGMGLSVVHGIVESHGGIITVSSTPGKGTTFDIFLPRLGGVLLEEAESSQSIPKGTETILLVDDEKVMVDMTKQMLERLGYTVVGKTSPIDALDAFQAEPNKFELVITDLAMPNMTGVQLAKEIISIRPDIPVILCTGFSEDIGPEEAKSMGIKEFVTKPVTKGKMAVIIRNVLDKKEVTV